MLVSKKKIQSPMASPSRAGTVIDSYRILYLRSDRGFLIFILLHNYFGVTGGEIFIQSKINYMEKSVPEGIEYGCIFFIV